MQRFAIVGPRWHGTLPAGVIEIRSPTSRGWLIGRTQTNGVRDYEAVHTFQNGLSVTPLSALGKRMPPAKGHRDPAQDMQPPVEQVDHMDAESFWALFASAVAGNAPHANDYPTLQRLRRVGVALGRGLDLAALLPASRNAMHEGVTAGREPDRHGRAAALHTGQPVGHDPLTHRHLRHGLLAARRDRQDRARRQRGRKCDLPERVMDAQGKALDSAGRYTIHFDKGKTPPARAFWSVTMYDRRQLFAANPINRYAIGDRSDLQYNADGSLDLYVQRESPGKERERNWLPTPADGPFSLTMRLYLAQAGSESPGAGPHRPSSARPDLDDRRPNHEGPATRSLALSLPRPLARAAGVPPSWRHVRRLHDRVELLRVRPLLARAVARLLPAAERHVIVEARRSADSPSRVRSASGA